VELAAVEALRERFFAAVRSREDLEHTAGGMVGGVPPGLPAPPVPLADAAAQPPAGEALGGATGPARAAGTEPSRLEPVAEGEPMPGGPATARTDVTPVASGGIDDVELSPGGSFDAGQTSLMEPAAPAAGDDWHEAPTGGFEVPPLPPGPHPGEPLEEDEGDLSGATRILARPRLVERGDGDGNREHVLALGRTSIGRASDNLVHLLDEAVSRHHGEIVPGPSGYLLRDLGSENGIFVNGERTSERLLHDGDVIQIGARTLVYRGA
jgi:hypothetical protein